MIAAYFFTAGTVAYYATVLAVRLVTTLVISSIIAKRMGDPGDPGVSGASLGNRVQLPPATDNKIGVVYGSAYMKPIITDVKISTDQKTMWYVTVFSEAMDTDAIGTFSFGDIYWGDKLLTFDGTDLTKVVGWTDSSGQNDTKASGKLNFYLYRDGSEKPINTDLKAWQVLQDSGIAEANRWDTSKKMTGLVFAIVKLSYDQDAGITGLADISAVITNSLTKPGSVIKDYLMNTRYGAGLAIERVNTASLTALDTYSDETISYTNINNTTSTAPRYRINGPIDTTKNFLDNLNQLADCCDSWLSFNEKENNWAIVINRSVYDLDPTGAAIPIIDATNIMGGINITPMDLNQSYSSVEVQFPNTRQRDQPGYYRLDIESFPNIVRSANEPDNSLSIALPFTNNIVEAQYIAGRRLLQSREDLSVTFTMDHSGIQIDAGDVIAITHERYDWENKFFRVNQVQEGKNEDGNLYAQITASEYNDGVYDDDNIDLQDFTLDLNTGITDPNYLASPYAPYITNQSPNAAVPSFDVNNVVPAGGTVVAVEYWYATTATINLNNYTLYQTALPSSSSIWAANTTATITVSGLGLGDYYFRTRLVGLRRKSEYSSPTDVINWLPNPIGTLVGQNFQSEFVPNTLTVRRDTTGTVYYSSAVARLYGQSGGALINYSGATSDVDARFVNNSWRIGATTSTWLQGITTDGLTITLSTSTVVDAGVNAQFNSPSFVNTVTGGTMVVPVRYKNSLGQVYQGIPASQKYQVLSDGINGTNGFNGSAGTGTNGLNGFVNFAYIPIGVEPESANNAQKTAAWISAVNREPVYNDNGTFWGPTTHKNYSYYGTSTQWTSATVFIDGDLVSTGTIRGAALVADAIYGKTFQSNNGYVGSYGSPGTWIDGNNGNARFAGTMNIGNNLTIGNSATIGNSLTIGTSAFIGSSLTIGDDLRVGNNATIGSDVYIGNNLTVAGLITNGALGIGVVTSSTLATDVRALISAGTGGTTGTQLGTPHIAASNSWNSTQYDWHWTSGFSVGFWRTIGYSDGLDAQAGSGSITVSYSCSNLSITGAPAYPNGPQFYLFMNYTPQMGSTPQLVFIPAGGSPLPSGATSGTGSSVYPQFGDYPCGTSGGTSHTGPYSLSATFNIPSSKTNVVIGVGFFNGNSNVNSNTGSFSVTGNTWSLTRT